MIEVKTSQLVAIARELDAALDALAPTHPAFAHLMQARAAFNVNVIHRLPLCTLFPQEGGEMTPGPGYEVDAAGTYLGH